jgi:hypothetical protein
MVLGYSYQHEPDSSEGKYDLLPMEFNVSLIGDIMKPLKSCIFTGPSPFKWNSWRKT